MCHSEKGRAATDGAGKMEEFCGFRSAVMRCLTQLTAVTEVQELNWSEKTSVTDSLFRVDVLQSAGPGAVQLRSGG